MKRKPDGSLRCVDSDGRESPAELLLPGTGRPLGLALLCALFALLGFVSILLSREPGRDALFFAGVLSASLAAVGTVFFLACLLPGGNHLILDEEGFTERILWRDRQVPWSLVGGFRVLYRQRRSTVAWSLAAAPDDFSGHERLLQQSYGYTPEALRDLLTERLETARRTMRR